MTETIELVAPAKLTLSLRVTGVRDDGYHLIDAEMVTLDLCDRLAIDPAGDGLRLVGGGPDVPADADNLVMKALALTGRTAEITLHKEIPSQAGLGGGSADAGAVLRWAGFRDLEAASRLGADVPFCIDGGRARVRGIGEVLDPMPHVDRTLTLLVPPLSCPTPAVFRAWDDLGGPVNDESPNDLEAAALAVVPELAQWRDEFAASTGQRPTMAGSGATWFVDGEHPGPRRLVVRSTPVGWRPHLA
ncbi:MAG: 4-(cytidine 5'-diphospho)-2-C-methyl-D-erythritol kinase [Acidimicrobiales bacterium]